MNHLLEIDAKKMPLMSIEQAEAVSRALRTKLTTTDYEWSDRGTLMLCYEPWKAFAREYHNDHYCNCDIESSGALSCYFFNLLEIPKNSERQAVFRVVSQWILLFMAARTPQFSRFPNYSHAAFVEVSNY